ncbi:DUF937 domain-containing protein [Calidifontibacter indicus]|uniref:DUF937 domain-containing protein n=1 Tax=Calidifontibacter indicus TaxID=419650 RepID=UPI003D738223
MDARQDILDQIPMDQLAAQVGADEQTTRAAAEQLIPALVGGLQANAQDEAGAQSLFDALGDHQGGTPALGQVDTREGQQIVSHVFGANQDEVVNRLGGMDGGAGGDILKKLLPILASIVLSYISGKVLSGGQAGGQATGQAAPTQDADAGGLGDILGSILGGMGGGQGAQGGLPGGLGEILGGILGGGRR